jgi:CBS domain-containing protein
MAERGVSGLAVLDDKGEAVGVVSASDIVRYETSRKTHVVSEVEYRRAHGRAREVLGEGFSLEHLDEDLVKDVMTPTIVTVGVDAGVAEMARLMSQKRIHRVFVREGPAVVGVITASDLARLLC